MNSIVRYFLVLTMLGVVGGVLVGCGGGDGAAPVCAAGSTQVCLCGGGGQGVQSCASDGSVWEACAGCEGCEADCTARTCGDDGCGGSCGTCVGDKTCSVAGACVSDCANCSGRACGDDGCGGSCGTCADDKTCSEAGACVPCTVDTCGKLYFYDAQIAGAVPVAKTGNTFQRYCRTSDVPAGTKLDGLAIDLELISTERKEQSETVFDNDKSIQVGDYINLHAIQESDLNPDNVRMQIDCVKRAGTELARDCEAGTDIMAPNSELVKVSHVKFADRGEVWGDGNGLGVGVVVLVDQSGSVSGFVQPDPELAPPDGTKPDRNYEMTYDDANLAITKWQQMHGDPGVLERLASDKKHYRVAALQDFISGLNKNDKLLVMTYNEDFKNQPVCAGAELESPTMKDCFSTRRDWVARGLNDIPGTESGRTPLWEAMFNAALFLQAETGVAAKHIVVLNDGPDTCYPGSEHFVGGSACGDRGFDDVVGLLETGTTDQPIHVHFVQYQAKGYPARDQAQAQLACQTEGTYTFVNRIDMGNSEFEAALAAGLDRARYSFLGKWRLFVESDVVSLDLPWPQGTPLGSAFATYGSLKLLPNPFVTAESIFTFSVGNQSNKEGFEQTPDWDNSLVFRKDCSQSSQCGGADADQCTARCGWESGLCFADDVALPVGTACTMDDGNGGVCCNDINHICQDPALACGE